VDTAIKELLDTGRILEVNQKPYCINPLSVANKSNGKHRLILDLGHVNKHVFKDKIKFDDWKIMNEYVNDNNYSFKFDLKQGYHHIEIHPDHQKYLGFSWVIDGKLKYSVFAVLPFITIYIH